MKFEIDRQAWRDFFITIFLLGIAFIIALLSSVAAQQRETRLAAISAAISLLLAVVGAIYIVPRLARKVQLEFVRLAVRTTVTVEGLFFFVLLMIVAIAAWNTGNNLLYLVLSTLVGYLLAANLIGRLSLTDVSVQLRFPDHIYAGETAALAVTITNHKRFTPTFSLMVEAPAKDKAAEASARSTSLGKLTHFMLAPAGASVRQRVEHKFEHRGCYRIHSFRISTKFPTGLFKKWRKIDASGEILVYPKPKPLDDFYHSLPMLAGQISSHLRGSGDDLYGLRRYHSTDHIRFIDWKATAKSNAVMVRENTREDERRLTIVFDTTRRWPPVTGSEAAAQEARFHTAFEKGIVMAASLANHFVQEGADVELITPAVSTTVFSGSGDDHLFLILRSLAMVEPAEKADKRCWGSLEAIPVLSDERRFKVLITSSPKGTIAAHIWRSAHVVFLEDL